MEGTVGVGNSTVEPIGVCYNLSSNTKNIAFFVQISLASVGLLLCIAVVTLIVVFRGYKRFIYRLVIYLMTAVAIHATAHIVDGLPVDRGKEIVAVKPGWNAACKAIAV